ncbi:MAG: hypothetical protein AAGA90_21780 [Actinomycetota bacterium]
MTAPPPLHDDDDLIAWCEGNPADAAAAILAAEGTGDRIAELETELTDVKALLGQVQKDGLQWAITVDKVRALRADAEDNDRSAFWIVAQLGRIIDEVDATTDETEVDRLRWLVGVLLEFWTDDAEPEVGLPLSERDVIIRNVVEIPENPGWTAAQIRALGGEA